MTIQHSALDDSSLQARATLSKISSWLSPEKKKTLSRTMYSSIVTCNPLRQLQAARHASGVNAGNSQQHQAVHALPQTPGAGHENLFRQALTQEHECQALSVYKQTQQAPSQGNSSFRSHRMHDDARTGHTRAGPSIAAEGPAGVALSAPWWGCCSQGKAQGPAFSWQLARSAFCCRTPLQKWEVPGEAGFNPLGLGLSHSDADWDVSTFEASSSLQV